MPIKVILFCSLAHHCVSLLYLPLAPTILVHWPGWTPSPVQHFSGNYAGPDATVHCQKHQTEEIIHESTSQPGLLQDLLTQHIQSPLPEDVWTSKHPSLLCSSSALSSSPYFPLLSSFSNPSSGGKKTDRDGHPLSTCYLMPEIKLALQPPHAPDAMPLMCKRMHFLMPP